MFRCTILAKQHKCMGDYDAGKLHQQRKLPARKRRTPMGKPGELLWNSLHNLCTSLDLQQPHH